MPDCVNNRNHYIRHNGLNCLGRFLQHISNNYLLSFLDEPCSLVAVEGSVVGFGLSVGGFLGDLSFDTEAFTESEGVGEFSGLGV